jgi:hypothetical protein
MAAVLVVIVFGLQSVLGTLGEDTPFFGGLHALFGFGALGIASDLLVAARKTKSEEGRS